jgi:two-component system NtrC family sensor kinase
MNPRLTPHRFSVALKIALVSWLVTIVSLLLFVAVIVPEQKRTFEENLSSKARGLSASLQDVIAGAAVTEDYSSVVDHCRQVLQGDESIVYIVITKNDGYSLIHESAPDAPPIASPGQRPEPRWRQQSLDEYWRPAIRKPTSGIDKVPLFDRRVFHYARPFDYSGIEWGWINVGLSIATYDQSVATVYTRTGLLAVVCIAFSLIVSILYARRLVRPLRGLQTVLQLVSSGDLSARASIQSGDEVESLADSFNTMTETLLQRDRILEGVRLAAQMFLFSTDWNQVIGNVLAKLGTASRASRVDVFVLHENAQGRLLISHRYEWVPSDTATFLGNPMLQDIPWYENGLDVLTEEAQSKGMVSGLLRQQNPALRMLLDPLGILSLVLTPIVVNGTWWGILCLSEGRSDRGWTDPEKDSLRAIADMLGAAIARHRTQGELVESKATLERRVQERTHELREQMQEKERAHSELAEAQHRLMEVSRQAGMAEVATGVLHNVGNVLNSVNVSTTLIQEKLRSSDVGSLVGLGQLLREHEADLTAFLTTDPRGQEVPRFILRLEERLQAEHASLRQEMEHLARNIEHIKEVVGMQQNYARVSGYLEQVTIPDLVDDALRLNAAALLRKRIQIVRHYPDIPLLLVDKHKVLQILVNLIQNAEHALTESGREDKQLTLTVHQPSEHRVEIAVLDNGIGIPPENITRIFSHGFSTRAGGHGFGLHIGALSAKEIGGELRMHSEGTGKGATFILELPINQQGPEPRSAL